jgi:predicted AAA+ superfamily ATPase
MAYIRRHAEHTVDALREMFGAVLVTGARQVGKSTMLEKLTKGMVALSMDNASIFAAAKNAPETFFAYNVPPLFIDEIQKAPDLFPEMKQVIDTSKGKGLFFMSGSEQFEMMENVSESLAGRVGIVNLMGLSLRERTGSNFTEEFLPTPDYFARRSKSLADNAFDPHTPNDVWRCIQRGDKPEMEIHSHFDWGRYYGAYVRTYIERDVRKLAQVEDELKFQTFMAVIAARTAQMINLNDIAGDVGISIPTAQRWLSILKTSNIIYLLRPYFTNLTKRAIKTPKLYFADTGLAAYLTQWNTPEVLRDGAMAGAFFETFIISEIVKSYSNIGHLDPPLYYYRDKDKREIDLLIYEGGRMHPLEIKKAGLGRPADISAFKVLDTLDGVERGPGGVICLVDSLQPLQSTDTMIPVSYL